MDWSINLNLVEKDPVLDILACRKECEIISQRWEVETKRKMKRSANMTWLSYSLKLNCIVEKKCLYFSVCSVSSPALSALVGNIRYLTSPNYPNNYYKYVFLKNWILWTTRQHFTTTFTCTPAYHINRCAYNEIIFHVLAILCHLFWIVESLQNVFQ